MPNAPLDRTTLLPEGSLPDPAALIATGRSRASGVGRSAFLEHHGVASEREYKLACAARGEVMFHAQVGYRDLEATVRACAEIHERLAAHGGHVDRYGICLDWSMGYPSDERRRHGRGTGLVLDDPADFARIAAAAPVAPHFGDFVIGTPAALENAEAALAAGATAIGNLGQYFTFRLPHWDDDVAVTARSVEAIALAAAEPVPVLVHSNLDDGFAALFRDLACALGAALVERHIVTDLLGARLSHCFGHTYRDPVERIAFVRALAAVDGEPGTMVYGNTTAYGPDDAANYAALATYLGADLTAQRLAATGHAVNAVPVSEARRIPTVDEIVDAQHFANRLAADTTLADLVDPAPIDALAARLEDGARRFAEALLAGLAERGIDTGNPVELMLALRRAGARRLEREFGPGASDPHSPGERRALVESGTLDGIERDAAQAIARLGDADRAAIAAAGWRACVASTDVHEYGKLLVAATLEGLGVTVVDGGTSVDPEVLAGLAAESGAAFIALGTYNGIALDYARALAAELARRSIAPPVFVGGRLNQIPTGSNTSLPVDVSAELERCGMRPCPTLEGFLEGLTALARG